MFVKKTRARIKHQHNLAGYVFISPWLIGFLLLTLWPILQSLYLSFTQYSLLDSPTWVGMQNFENIFQKDRLFVKSLAVTFTFVLFAVPVKLFFSLMVAMLLNRDIKGMSFYRTLIYFPSLIGGSIAVAALWRNMFGLDGYINHVLGWFGIEGIGWISNPSTALSTLVLLSAWQFGSTMVIFLAGLKQIPKDLYESASVDGAGVLRKFWNITLPIAFAADHLAQAVDVGKLHRRLDIFFSVHIYDLFRQHFDDGILECAWRSADSCVGWVRFWQA